MSLYRILFLGDVVGKPGREAVLAALPRLIHTFQPLFVIVNGENASNGAGITPAMASEILTAGADVLTLGNHAFHARELLPELERGRLPIIRPLNFAPGTPGRGSWDLSKDGVSLRVLNLCGRVFMQDYDDPFRTIDSGLLSDGQHYFIDFHAEATSEKIAFARHVDGRATAVIGTHTHVQTNDAQILPGGTAYLSDAGMCGSPHGVIGMSTASSLRRFLTSLPSRFEVADGPGVISGVLIDVYRDTGLAQAIRLIGQKDIGATE